MKSFILLWFVSTVVLSVRTSLTDPVHVERLKDFWFVDMIASTSLVGYEKVWQGMKRDENKIRGETEQVKEGKQRWRRKK